MRLIAATIAVAVLSIAAVGCSDSDPSSSAPEDASDRHATTERTEPEAPRRSTITMGAPDEFAMVPEVREVAAGRVTLEVANEGLIEHEVVLIKTGRDSGDLPTDESGAALEHGAVAPHGDDGEHAADDHHVGVHFASGTRGTVMVDLEPGNYAVVCNLPGHYAAGMHANLKVT